MNKQPKSQQSPQERLNSLNHQLKQILNIKSVTEAEGWKEVDNLMRSLITQRRKSRDNLNWEDSADAFLAFKEKASYMTGFIQGAEYMINYINARPLAEANIRQKIKEVESEVKGVRSDKQTRP